MLYTHNPAPPHSLTVENDVEYFAPENPPFAGAWKTRAHSNWWFYRVDEMLHEEGSEGSMTDHHKTLSLDRYKTSSFSAMQKYFFYCELSLCPAHTNPEVVNGPHAGEFTILREVTKPDDKWLYILSKTGSGVNHVVTKELVQ